MWIMFIPFRMHIYIQTLYNIDSWIMLRKEDPVHEATGTTNSREI